MEIVDHSLHQPGVPKDLFSSEIEGNPWVFYHATSSVYEASIESEGLLWKPSVCSQTDLEAIARIYKSINWCGLNRDGYAVIESFSLQGDFRNTGRKPIFFREYSIRSLHYAGKSWAGGESATAVRNALEDLDAYISDPRIRDQHYERQRDACIRLVKSGGIPSKVIKVNLEWLTDRVKELEPLRTRCDSLLHAHRYGIMFAVIFKPEDLAHLEFCPSSGLRCYKPLTPDRIVGKARIFLEDAKLLAGNNAETWMKNPWREEDPAGLLHALRRLRENIATPEVQEAKEVLPHLRNVFIDEAAGENEAMKIALEFGTPAVIDYVRENPFPDWNS
jgi:hypothetical protein